MADVLKLLRQAWTKDPSSVKEKGDYIMIGDQSYHKSTKTNYIIWGTGKDDVEKDYYKLETVFFLLSNSSQAHTIYVRHAMAENVDVIRRVDRKDILLFLNGKIETTPSIDKTMPFEVSQPPSKKIKPDLTTNEEKSKKPDPQEDDKRKNIDDHLSKALSLDTIASIKAKFKRQQQQKKNDLSVPSKDEEPEDFYLKTLKDKSCRNRNSITSSISKNFLTNLNTLINLVKRKESLNLKKAESSKQNSSSSYNRYNQEKFNSNELSEFGIQSISSNKNTTETKSSQISTNKSGSRVSQIPIIIVPPQTVSPFIGIDSIQTFLEDFRYKKTVSSSVELNKPKLYLYKKYNISDAGKPYQVVDQPLKQLSKEDWKRVVCVFVHGPAWQFKNWPFKGGPVEILQKMKGIHCKWTNSQNDKNISKMNVEVFEFNPRSRHSDYVTIKRIWDSIESFASKNKPFLDV